MTWRQLTAKPENLEAAMIAEELRLVSGITAIPPAPPGSTIDPDSLRVETFGKRLSDTDYETHVVLLYQDIVAATVTWHANLVDAETPSSGVSGTPNAGSLRMKHIGVKNGHRFDSKMLVIYST